MSGVELERKSNVSRQYISNLERNLRSEFTGQLVQPSVEHEIRHRIFFCQN